MNITRRGFVALPAAAALLPATQFPSGAWAAEPAKAERAGRHTPGGLPPARAGDASVGSSAGGAPRGGESSVKAPFCLPARRTGTALIAAAADRITHRPPPIGRR